MEYSAIGKPLRGNMKDEGSFRTFLSAPLEAVVSRTLLGVTYWLLNSDEPSFHIDRPNESGISGMSLSFEGLTVEISSFYDKILRTRDNYFYIQALLVSGEKEEGELATAEVLCNIPADQATIWCDALNTPLVRAEIYGDSDTPQVFRLSFPSTVLIISLGYSGEKLFIGDGNDLLVFSEAQWQSSIHLVNAPLSKIWECAT